MTSDDSAASTAATTRDVSEGRLVLAWYLATFTIVALILALLQPFAVEVPFQSDDVGHVRLGAMLAKFGAQSGIVAGLIAISVTVRTRTHAIRVPLASLTVVGALLGGLFFIYDGFWMQLGLEIVDPRWVGNWGFASLIALFWISPAIGLVLDAAITLVRSRRGPAHVCVTGSMAALLLMAAATWSMFGEHLLAGNDWIW
ncbi:MULTISPECIES: hypothetical protein [unclassified Agrococcus]|uniref:hypothetical protein n=1 Tax=unclassified Agrococcus TaxID=2615065 RepID=UPI00361244BD